ncbi:hypothetical protein Tco_1056492 [Tanacetum coccineum]|uniref:Uncharacterized protein n=1 Tax=Tanacetum coccineum TaxID=301880 RepID=A0ABQ5H3A8_9ASTR
MAMRVPPVMSSGLSASMAEVAAISESAFRKRFRSSYKSLPSLSPSDLSSRKRYRGTSELVEDSEEGDDAKDEEIEESMDSDSVSEDAEDEGPTAEDEEPLRKENDGLTAKGQRAPDMNSHGMDDESRGLDDEGHGVESDGLGLEEEEEVVPGGQQKAAPVVGIAMSAPLGLGYRALRHRELELEEDHIAHRPQPDNPRNCSLPISPSPSIVPSPISSPMIPLTVPSLVATPATVETEGFLTEMGAQVEMQGGLIRDHAVRLEELSLALSLEYQQERVAVTFGAIWRLVLALESWTGQTDAQRAALWHAISDV